MKIHQTGRRNSNLTKVVRFLKELQKEIPVSNKKIRDFGWVMLIVLSGIVPLFISWRNDWSITELMLWFFGIGLVLFVPSVTFPKAMTGIYRGWMTLAILLGLLMTKVIISLVFIFLMTPIGLIRRMLVKDPLKMERDERAETYWVDKEERDRTSYEKQY